MDRRPVVIAFLLTTLLALIPAVYLILTVEAFELHRMLNLRHNPFFDPLFRYATYLADGRFPTIIAVLLLFIRNIRSALLVGIATLSSGMFSQLLKVLFARDRPSMYLEQMPDLRLLEGLDLANHYSFPSGHATAAFSLCFALALMWGRAGYAVILALIACLLAYTRVWLSQHFMEDITVGAIIGIVFAWLSFYFLHRAKWTNGKEWLKRRIRFTTTPRDPEKA